MTFRDLAYAEEPVQSCGHDCCSDTDPLHDHFLRPQDCARCKAVSDAWPRTVTLCGSMSAFPAMLAKAGELTAQGMIVYLPVPIEDGDPEVLRRVHFAKIATSDEVVVFPKLDGSCGEATTAEAHYAASLGVLVQAVNSTQPEVEPVSGADCMHCGSRGPAWDRACLTGCPEYKRTEGHAIWPICRTCDGQLVLIDGVLRHRRDLTVPR